MIELRADPANPERVLVVATVSLWMEKVLIQALGKELEEVITEAAKKDLQGRAVRKEIKALATKKLIQMLEEKK